jgi:hypothetical protein
MLVATFLNFHRSLLVTLRSKKKSPTNVGLPDVLGAESSACPLFHPWSGNKQRSNIAPE